MNVIVCVHANVSTSMCAIVIYQHISFAIVYVVQRLYIYISSYIYIYLVDAARPSIIDGSTVRLYSFCDHIIFIYYYRLSTKFVKANHQSADG